MREKGDLGIIFSVLSWIDCDIINLDEKIKKRNRFIRSLIWVF